ncbi:MAG: phosphonate ABC transporter substrate-binding protein, partial [Campylobacterales bacterium]|nr:phosphonate ABC transporter substrate-binding protein [Campylobacterales bacterium]
MEKSLTKKLATLALALTMGTTLLAQEKWPNKITFGVIPVAGSTSMKENFGPLTKYLEKQLGIKVEMKLAG